MQDRLQNIRIGWQEARTNPGEWTGYFDGACPDNRAIDGRLKKTTAIRIGAILLRNGEPCQTISEDAGEGTSNVAEYKALIALLEIAIENQVGDLTIFGDSQLIILQVQGYYRVKKSHLLNLHSRARRLIKQLSRVRFGWIPREENTVADKLSKTKPRKTANPTQGQLVPRLIKQVKSK